MSMTECFPTLLVSHSLTFSLSFAAVRRRTTMRPPTVVVVVVRSRSLCWGYVTQRVRMFAVLVNLRRSTSSSMVHSRLQFLACCSHGLFPHTQLQQIPTHVPTWPTVERRRFEALSQATAATVSVCRCVIAYYPRDRLARFVWVCHLQKPLLPTYQMVLEA